MKSLLVTMALSLFSLSSFASPELTALLGSKKKCNIFGSVNSVTRLVTSGMLSYFNEKGEGALAVSKLDCEKNSAGNKKCFLSINSVDAEEASEGYMFEGGTESSIGVSFEVSPKGKIVGEVGCIVAG